MTVRNVVIEDDGGNGIPLDEIWAWVAVHSEDNESIITVGGLPMIVQKESLARGFRNVAQELARRTGKPQRLVRLVRAEVVDEVS